MATAILDPGVHPRSPATGQFTPSAHSAPEMKLAELVTVALANGREAQLPVGAWTEQAAEAYQSGQCLALAVALAEEMGDHASVGCALRGDGELSHAIAFVTDENGGEWAFDSYGRVKFDEWLDERGIDEDDDDAIVWLTPAAARAREWTLLPPQNFELAASFAPGLAADA